MSQMDPEKPETNIVLVVHGIGEQAPGMTIAGLAGAAAHRLGIYGNLSGRVDLLVESGPDEPLLKQFPCTIRTAEFTCPEISDRPQRVLAGEVYWADISSAPRGALATIVELFQTILGLGYLALDNVDHARKDDPLAGRVWDLQCWLVRRFVMVFYTLVAPFNATLLMGSLLLVASGRQGAGKAAVLAVLLPLLLGAACLGLGTIWHKVLKRPDSTYLLRSFMTGLIGIGAVLLVVAGAILLSAGALPITLDSAGNPPWPMLEACVGTGKAINHPTLCAVAGWLVLGMASSYVLAVACLCAMFLLAVFEVVLLRGDARRMRDMAQHPLSALTGWIATKQTIHLPICSAMLLSWTLLSASFWSMFSTIIAQMDRGPADGPSLLAVDIYGRVSGQATATLPYAMSAFALVAVVSALVLWYRNSHKTRLVDANAPALEVWIGRLLLNPIISLALFVCVIWVTVGTLLAVHTTLKIDLWPFLKPLSGLHDLMNGLRPAFLWAAGLTGLLIYQFSNQVSAGLGVVRDIATYSTRSHARLREGRGQYPLRDRIERRFAIVERHLRAQMKDPDRIIIVAHSLGTMIAFSAIARESRRDRPVFLTMGSPLAHIYHHYFPRNFDLQNVHEQVGPWLNIYRCDDFVGTRICVSEGVPLNHPVEPRGHVGYWTDRQVWDKVISLLPRAAARRPADPTPPAAAHAPPLAEAPPPLRTARRHRQAEHSPP